MAYLAGILAGGMGSRMSIDLPKQFLSINGKPVIVRTIEKFANINKFNKIYIAIHKEWIGYCEDLLNKHNVDMSKIKIVLGGETRFLSMYNLIIEALQDGYSEDNMVIHDCARPFVPDRVILELIDKKNSFDMVTASQQTIDTILVSKDGEKSDYMPDRSTIYLDQGPQIFNVYQLKNLIDRLTNEEKLNFIEAGRVFLENNLSVGIVKGDRLSFKITNMFDVAVAEVIAKQLDVEMN